MSNKEKSKSSENKSSWTTKTKETLSSSRAKEVYKVVGAAAVGATIAALTGFKIDIGK